MKGLVESGRVSLKMLRYFYVLSQTEHFGKAARLLNITASPLSFKIRQLEELLGVELVYRNSRHVELTEAGAQLACECRLIFDHMDNALNKVIRIGREQNNIINIGLNSSVFQAGFDQVMSRFRTFCPDSKVTFHEISPDEQKRRLIDNSIDMGLVRYSDTENIEPLSRMKCYEENMCVVVSHRHSFSSLKQVSLWDIRQEEIILLNRNLSATAQMVVNSCLVLGFNPTIRQEVNEVQTLMEVIRVCDDVVAVVPESTARASNQFHILELREKLPADLYAIYLDDQLTRIGQQFLKALQSASHPEGE
ncbi:LysR substrate-binding domain-containing protein [Endozoicomonadaceae bacterium StTr2]